MAQFKVNQAQDNLKRAEERYDENNKDLMETQQKYAKTMAEMVQIDASLMSTKKVIGVLMKVNCKSFLQIREGNNKIKVCSFFFEISECFSYK